jgi:competence protein ComEC
MPLTWVSLAFLLGILLASRIPLPWTAWLIIAAGSTAVLFLLHFSSRRWPHSHILAAAARLLTVKSPALFLAPGVLFVFLALGAARYEARQSVYTAQSLSGYTGGTVSLTAWVDSPPEAVENGIRADVRIESVGSQPHGGRVRVTLPAGSDRRYGDTVSLTGKLTEPFEAEDFSYKDYLARQGISAVMYFPKVTALPSKRGNFILSGLYALRDRGNTALAQIFPAPESSLLQGILLGDDSRIPDDIYQDFRDTGTSHIIAISGFNVAILAGLIASLFTRLLGNRKGSLAAIIGISLYTVLVGASASVVRACIMGGLGLLAAQIGRRQNGINTLAFTAAVMSLQNPLVLQDTGFQLSFAATLGLILYAAPLQAACASWLSRFLGEKAAGRAAGLIGEYFLFTLAAQVTTLPILVLTFQRFSPVTFLANPLVLPAQPLLMILGGLALLCGLLSLPLGRIVGLAAWPFAAYTIRVDEWLGPVARSVMFSRSIEPVWIVLFYMLLAVISLRPLRDALKPHLKPGLALLTAGVAAVCVWQAVFDRPDGRLHLWVFGKDQTSEKAVLIQTPAGRTLLFGSLGSSSTLNSFLGRQLPFGSRTIDAVILPPASANQMTALSSALEQDVISLLLWSGSLDNTQAGAGLQGSIQNQGGIAIEASPGQQLDLGSGAILTLQSADEGTLSARVEWNRFSAILLSNTPTGEQEFDPPPVVWIQLKTGCAPPSSFVYLAVCDTQGDTDISAVNRLSFRDHDWVHLSTDGEQLTVEVKSP